MRVLITGENGYISNELEKYFKCKSVPFEVIKKSIRVDSLDNIDLIGVDIVIHTAAIVHKKETKINESIYFEVNTKLTKFLAEKAKMSGVKQFIFFSTMAVYGDVRGEISNRTVYSPTSLYGKSKLAAEEILQELNSNYFNVAIVRPPMVYGPKCPGNYRTLSVFSRKSPIFPDIENVRSMIFIYNLTEFIYQLVKNHESGIFHPQDSDFINTTELVKEIGIAHKKKIFTNFFVGKLLKKIIGRKAIYQKVFGDLYYAKKLSNYKDNSYQKYNLKEAILISEKG